MASISQMLDKHLFPDLASIVLEYYNLEFVDVIIHDYRDVYTMLFGKKHGEFKRYYRNGKLRESGYYNNGERHGEFKGYYQTGVLKESYQFMYDLRHGYCNGYYSNSQLQYSYYFVDDMEVSPDEQ